MSPSSIKLLGCQLGLSPYNRRNDKFKLRYYFLFSLVLTLLTIGHSNAVNYHYKSQLTTCLTDTERTIEYYANSDKLYKPPIGCGKNFAKYVSEGFSKFIQPCFPGGDEEMIRFVPRNIKYPYEAYRANAQGTVYIEFTVNSDGQLSDFKIIKSANKWLDMEALRVIKLFPKWLPGTIDDIPASVQVSVPIKFRLVPR